jgi:hypothetical protein
VSDPLASVIDAHGGVTKHGIVPRTPGGQSLTEPLVVSIDLSEIVFRSQAEVERQGGTIAEAPQNQARNERPEPIES